MTPQNCPQAGPVAAAPHPIQLEVLDFPAYSLVIDARSPHEYDEDHVPGAVNLPVVDDVEYAEVGTQHRTDPHAAYLIGVRYSLRNIAGHIDQLVGRFTPADRLMVYCFRGGKRSKLWADALRTIGFEVDVLRGGWKAYRRWVLASLDVYPRQLDYRVLTGSTGAGKTRLLHALDSIGEQVLDLEALASHRGSLIGSLPGQEQPTQKFFDSLLLDRVRRFDPTRPVWIEAESKKIGQVQLPDALFGAMHASTPIRVETPMAERVRLWREDYAHLAADPVHMVDQLAPIKPLVGSKAMEEWRHLAQSGEVDRLFEAVMRDHYDPCYERSTRRSYGALQQGPIVTLASLAPDRLEQAASDLRARFG